MMAAADSDYLCDKCTVSVSGSDACVIPSSFRSLPLRMHAASSVVASSGLALFVVRVTDPAALD